MALNSTVRSFEIQLSDIDRGVYETLAVRVAQHPSETDAFLVTRMLAFALEQEEGLSFSGGLGAADEPALWVRDLTGQLQAWIEVGTPEPARLHKASKAVDRVVVYCHHAPRQWLEKIAAAKIHRAQHLRVVGVPRAIVATLADALERRNTWSLTRTEGTLYLEAGPTSVEFSLDALK